MWAEMILHAEHFSFWGFAGVIFVLAGCIIPSVVYKGRMGQKYSLKNHFISELGERNVSRLAAIFNACLITAGILFAVFMVQFGRYLGTVPAIFSAAAGLFSSLACCMVGIYPMDTMEKHDRAAICFFVGGLATILLFSITSLMDGQHRLPIIFVLFAVLVAVAFAAFLLLPRILPKPAPNIDRFGPDRPAVWALTIVEWLAMLGIIGWIAAVSFYFVL